MTDEQQDGDAVAHSLQKTREAQTLAVRKIGRPSDGLWGRLSRLAARVGVQHWHIAGFSAILRP